jgi:hypothetical protein
MKDSPLSLREPAECGGRFRHAVLNLHQICLVVELSARGDLLMYICQLADQIVPRLRNLLVDIYDHEIAVEGSKYWLTAAFI